MDRIPIRRRSILKSRTSLGVEDMSECTSILDDNQGLTLTGEILGAVEGGSPTSRRRRVSFAQETDVREIRDDYIEGGSVCMDLTQVDHSNEENPSIDHFNTTTFFEDRQSISQIISQSGDGASASVLMDLTQISRRDETFTYRDTTRVPGTMSMCEVEDAHMMSVLMDLTQTSRRVETFTPRNTTRVPGTMSICEVEDVDMMSVSMDLTQMSKGDSQSPASSSSHPFDKYNKTRYGEESMMDITSLESKDEGQENCPPTTLDIPVSNVVFPMEMPRKVSYPLFVRPSTTQFGPPSVVLLQKPHGFGPPVSRFGQFGSVKTPNRHKSLMPRISRPLTVSAYAQTSLPFKSTPTPPRPSEVPMSNVNIKPTVPLSLPQHKTQSTLQNTIGDPEGEKKENGGVVAASDGTLERGATPLPSPEKILGLTTSKVEDKTELTSVLHLDPTTEIPPFVSNIPNGQETRMDEISIGLSESGGPVTQIDLAMQVVEDQVGRNFYELCHQPRDVDVDEDEEEMSISMSIMTVFEGAREPDSPPPHSHNLQSPIDEGNASTLTVATKESGEDTPSLVGLNSSPTKLQEEKEQVETLSMNSFMIMTFVEGSGEPEPTFANIETHHSPPPNEKNQTLSTTLFDKMSVPEPTFVEFKEEQDKCTSVILPNTTPEPQHPLPAEIEKVKSVKVKDVALEAKEGARKERFGGLRGLNKVRALEKLDKELDLLSPTQLEDWVLIHGSEFDPKWVEVTLRTIMTSKLLTNRDEDFQKLLIN